jgi:hypothetical protein
MKAKAVAVAAVDESSLRRRQFTPCNYLDGPAGTRASGQWGRGARLGFVLPALLQRKARKARLEPLCGQPLRTTVYGTDCRHSLRRGAIVRGTACSARVNDFRLNFLPHALKHEGHGGLCAPARLICTLLYFCGIGTFKAAMFCVGVQGEKLQGNEPDWTGAIRGGAARKHSWRRISRDLGSSV